MGLSYSNEWNSTVFHVYVTRTAGTAEVYVGVAVESFRLLVRLDPTKQVRILNIRVNLLRR